MISTLRTLPVLLLAVLHSISLSGQSVAAKGKIVAFHPSVGTVVTAAEKKEFGIFQEYDDALFESAQLVKYDSSHYAVLISTTKGTSFERDMPLPELDLIYKKIESVKPLERMADPGEDDYVVDTRSSREKEARKKRNENAQLAGEITIQILFVFLEILANWH